MDMMQVGQNKHQLPGSAPIYNIGGLPGQIRKSKSGDGLHNQNIEADSNNKSTHERSAKYCVNIANSSQSRKKEYDARQGGSRTRYLRVHGFVSICICVGEGHIIADQK
jgi:hypothetical protein